MIKATIGDISIDCREPEKLRRFYAEITGWESRTMWSWPALIAGNGLVLLFMGCDFDFVPPVWPEEPGKQQKQMHLDMTVDNLKSAVKKALRLGAAEPSRQYGGSYYTLLDPEGHPFCLCQREKKKTKSEFDLYYEKMGYGAIPDVSVNIDCQEQRPLRKFYAELTGWDTDFHWGVLVADNRMIVCFQGCDADATMEEYIPPVWPEEPGKQQKQMHLNLQVDDLPSAVEEALCLGAAKPAKQYSSGEHYVTLLDPQGHPFCLCRN